MCEWYALLQLARGLLCRHGLNIEFLHFCRRYLKRELKLLVNPRISAADRREAIDRFNAVVIAVTGNVTTEYPPHITNILYTDLPRPGAIVWTPVQHLDGAHALADTYLNSQEGSAVLDFLEEIAEAQPPLAESTAYTTAVKTLVDCPHMQDALLGFRALDRDIATRRRAFFVFLRLSKASPTALQAAIAGVKPGGVVEGIRELWKAHFCDCIFRVLLNTFLEQRLLSSSEAWHAALLMTALASEDNAERRQRQVFMRPSDVLEMMLYVATGHSGTSVELRDPGLGRLVHEAATKQCPRGLAVVEGMLSMLGKHVDDLPSHLGASKYCLISLLWTLLDACAALTPMQLERTAGPPTQLPGLVSHFTGGWNHVRGRHHCLKDLFVMPRGGFWPNDGFLCDEQDYIVEGGSHIS